ncbi:MAG TPA: PVC-type heme-binding CxxCH protein [Chitinophagaceae bacterium]|nr:PVC-type heme-binding CxxCH protein [Chitinophagaceae bacterium]
MITKKIVHRNLFYLLGLLAIAGTSCKHQPDYPGPLSAGESIKTFHFAGDFKAEIYATEPLVADPISMVFDENGNTYVVEMADANMPDSLKGHGQIVMLKDTNGDGRADTSIVFARGLTEATTVLPWKGGLIVTAAPNILYLKDTDGDGKADKREVLYSGFFHHNDEAQITSLRFGVDNWIYANNDGEPGEVTSTRKPGAPKLSMQGADFRFRLDRNEFERTTGPGQYGQAIDDWGHRFFTKNSLHIQEVVIPWRYMHRNPYLPPSASQAIKNISDHDPIMYQLTPAPYWRAERTRRRNKKYQEHHLDRVEYAKDHFTGSSGGTFYGGDAFPKEYYGSIFTGDVSGNLVHRDVLTLPNDPNDPFYTASRSKQEKGKEFLAATDTWVRPTNFTVGPEGYLYMVDMYRQHIETPVSIPDDLAAEMDFSAGSNLGRIYRIVPKNAGTFHATTTNLTAKTSAELVHLLSDPNRWQRLHAHKLLIERQDKSVIPAVKNLLQSSKDPRVRIQALYVLEGLNALDATIVNNALKDPAPGIRENAAILSERFPECLPGLENLVNDSSARVAFQATLSLGGLDAKEVTPALVKVLDLRGKNSWFRTAVLSADTSSTVDLIKALTRDNSFLQNKMSWKKSFLKDISYEIGARNEKKQVTAFLSLLTQSPMAKSRDQQSACIKGLTNGLKKSVPKLAGQLDNIEKASGNDIDGAIGQLKALVPNT